MNYTMTEQMIVACSRQIKDGAAVYTGVGIPTMAVLLAKLTHAPNITILFETGIIRTEPCQLPEGVDTLATQAGADMLTSGYYLNTLAERGFIEYAVIGAGQIDRYGNVNSTCVGSYENPVFRYPGSGGGCDLISLCNKTIMVMKQKKPRFPEHVDFITSPGYLDGTPGAREKAGLPENTGPYKVITDMAVFAFLDRELAVETVHTGINTKRIIGHENMNWEVKRTDPVTDTLEPTPEELKLLRTYILPCSNKNN